MGYVFPPQYLDVNEAFARGVTAQTKGDLTTAVEEWQRTIALAPHHAPALYNLAVAMSLLGNENEVAENYEKLLKFQPSHKDALFNLANLRKRQKRDSEAESLYRQLTGAYPNFASGWINFAKVYSDRGDLIAAVSLLRKALTLDPTHIIGHWNLSHLLLRMGSWEEAWKEYEWRLQIPNWLSTPVAAKTWTKGIPAKRILLWNDQGMGDALQFLRYPRILAEQGHEVWVLVQKELKSVAASALGVTGAIGPSDLFPDVDTQAPLLSMPHRLGLPDPLAVGTTPYLTYKKIMSLPRKTKQLAVGLVWAGNQKFKNDVNRSASLSSLKTLFEIDGIDWYSLQFNEARSQIRENSLSDKIEDLSVQLRDFSDTAAALNALDLVISVDTSVAHLAGALGRPCWLMLSTTPDWRFVNDEATRRWYPTLRTFRQTHANDWQSVATDIAAALRNLLP
ncbi:MAG: tetratricopeptide repeat-containing glycosyltransferase family protein [Bdellovibrionales bacterium]|jgi:Tfp pilus assembly protein PilF